MREVSPHTADEETHIPQQEDRTTTPDDSETVGDEAGDADGEDTPPKATVESVVRHVEFCGHFCVTGRDHRALGWISRGIRGDVGFGRTQAPTTDVSRQMMKSIMSFFQSGQFLPKCQPHERTVRFATLLAMDHWDSSTAAGRARYPNLSPWHGGGYHGDGCPCLRPQPAKRCQAHARDACRLGLRDPSWQSSS